MLPPSHRLRSAASFRAVMRGPGRSRWGGRLVVVHAFAVGGPDAPARVGFVVSKAVGGAVVRNRTKRRLRAIMAGRLAGIPDGTDVVVRANPAAADATYGELDAELDRLLGRAVEGAGS